MECCFFQEILDRYFIQLEQLGENNPGFVEDVLTVYFRDSTRTLANIEKELQKTEVNYVELDRYFYNLKGSSASIGANKVRNEVNKTRELCRAANWEEAKVSLEQLKVEHSTLKDKLTAYFELVAQLGTDSD
ncbi:histidine-containing phosphotransfer protein 2 [Citrus sinensis]|uniref:Histidine-containing phosphotransfer protein 2 n=1 Tax=Citrus sinensis TaxID=2711 RepID=A0ACB8NS13_CITSI|nr:histidine-containing phosphotransfer protein 4-like [Citrus x clementina]KAH9762596.1 histidine-containing phosphotransfer protein 2 [Citrus sinensis]KAH9801002.1 histidine-containing phosphotransfer protein 2 [Citrus sinensis]